MYRLSLKIYTFDSRFYEPIYDIYIETDAILVCHMTAQYVVHLAINMSTGMICYELYVQHIL